MPLLVLGRAEGEAAEFWSGEGLLTSRCPAPSATGGRRCQLRHRVPDPVGPVRVACTALWWAPESRCGPRDAVREELGWRPYRLPGDRRCRSGPRAVTGLRLSRGP